MMMNAQKKDPQLVAQVNHVIPGSSRFVSSSFLALTTGTAPVRGLQIQDMIERGLEPQQIADALLEQAERVKEGLPATKEGEQEYFPDEIIIVRMRMRIQEACCTVL